MSCDKQKPSNSNGSLDFDDQPEAKRLRSSYTESSDKSSTSKRSYFEFLNQITQKLELPKSGLANDSNKRSVEAKPSDLSRYFF